MSDPGAPLWTAGEVLSATGGKGPDDWDATSVSIDTRTLAPGALFVALKDQRDGHDFVAAALAAGAAAALVSRRPGGVAADAPLVVVPDVLGGLVDLARAARSRTRAKVIGVTGSVGKTSTKEMLRAVLSGQGATHAAEASYNNHWGVPLTLARMPAATAFAVIEIGMNHPGEIAPLARLADLDVAVITSVAAAHLEAFPSVTAIAEEKAAILDGLRPGGTAVLNLDLETTPILLARAAAVGANVVGFGRAAGADFRLDAVHLAQAATVLQAHRHGAAFAAKISAPGAHFAMNALAALAVAEAVGCDPAIATCDLGLWLPPPGRGTRERIATDPVEDQGFELIDDAFNANPASMAAALDVLIAAEVEDGVGRIGSGRRIAVLGDMLELGPEEDRLHRAIADHPGLERIATIHCVGPRMRALHETLPRRQQGEWVATAPELAARARALVDAGDIILVKGSKGSKVSLVVDALRRLAPVSPSRSEGSE